MMLFGLDQQIKWTPYNLLKTELTSVELSDQYFAMKFVRHDSDLSEWLNSTRTNKIIAQVLFIFVENFIKHKGFRQRFIKFCIDRKTFKIT